MNTFKTVICSAALIISTNASAGLVNVWGETRDFDLNIINNFYNGLSGHSSVRIGGTLDANDLTGVDLLWATQPADAYTGAELNSMASYLSTGGRIAFMGEHGSYTPAENDRINTALTFLGAEMQIQNSIVDGGFHMATRVNGQILNHSLTAGVNRYEYAAFAPLVSLSGDAQALMLGSDLSSVMMAFDNVGAGSVFLITDQNVWDRVANTGNNDNAIMFENLLSASTVPTPVAAPGALALLGLGLVGLGLTRRKSVSA